MKVITLSKKKFSSLEPMKLSRGVISTEANFLHFNYHGENKVIKRLYYQDGDVFANKLHTLEMLSAYKKYLPESFCIPDALISVSGKVEGFSMPLIEGINLSTLLMDRNTPLEEKKYYLTKVGEILKQLKTIRKYSPLNDIYLCDLHSSNFIAKTDNKQLEVLDLDSCKIKGGRSPISRYLGEFALLNNVKGKYKINKDENSGLGYVDADENSDLYCYSMMLLSFLYGGSINTDSLDDYYKYLTYLKKIGVNEELVNVFYDLLTNKDNTNPCNLIESLTEEQVCRANEKVYKKVKKKFV